MAYLNEVDVAIVERRSVLFENSLDVFSFEYFSGLGKGKQVGDSHDTDLFTGEAFFIHK